MRKKLFTHYGSRIIEYLTRQHKPITGAIMDRTILRKPDSFYTSFERKPGAEKHATHYCPGCGHGNIHKLIAEAIDDFGINNRAVFISPVGCSVFGYYYFHCGNIQAAHGRAPAVATGARRALPESIVISYQGDGDLAAIGGNEILQAANRGENITVIFVNNAIYGMTGGQMAPTTLLGMKTTTTPYGRNFSNEGYPLRVCELLATLDAPAYIERVAITDAKNVMAARKAIRKAIQYQMEGRGFTLVELLSTCPTGWKLTPAASKKWLIENMLPVFPLGVFRDKKELTPSLAKPAPEAQDMNEEAIRERLDIAEKDYLGRKHSDARPRYLNPRIKIAGFGGQGILFAGMIMAEAGMRVGRNVSWLPSYGPEMRGGTAHCHVIISEKPIGSPLISEADVLMAMNRPSLEKFQQEVRPGGAILYNSSLISPPRTDSELRKRSGAGIELRDDIEILPVPVTEIADELGNTKVSNVVMLGAFLGFSKIMPEGAVLSALNDKVGRPGIAEFNERALRAGIDYVSKGDWRNGFHPQPENLEIVNA
jgi:2-oxoisovalerate ferredoxin oxidoreductase beta subunit